MNHVIPLIINQKMLQPGFNKGVNRFLYFLPVCAVIADHKLVDRQAAVHLEIKDCFGFFEGKDTVGHQPGDIVFLMICHLVNDPCGDQPGHFLPALL